VVIFKHALRNSLIPIVTGLGNAILLVLAGSYLIEKVFNIAGKWFNNISRIWVLGYIHGYQDCKADYINQIEKVELTPEVLKLVEQEFQNGTLKYTKAKGLHRVTPKAKAKPKSEPEPQSGYTIPDEEIPF